MTDIILEVKNLHKSFGDQKILDGVNLTFERGKISVIIGKSGTGKSVLLKNIIGILSPEKGSIIYEGKEMVGASEMEWLDMRRSFGYLFQDAALFDSMNVEENIAFPMVELLGMKRGPEMSRKVSNLLELIELPGIERKLPSELSGGMRKRVGLARALAVEPKVILFDEPTTGLDPILAESIDNLTLKINRELGLTCIVISHDIAATFRIADRIAFLYEGNIEFFGTPTEAEKSAHPVLNQFIENTFKRSL